MKLPEITSIIAFEEGRHKSMFAMTEQEMEDITDKVSKLVEQDKKREEQEGDE